MAKCWLCISWKIAKSNMYHGKILFLRGRKIRRSGATPIKICKLNNHQNLKFLYDTLRVCWKASVAKIFEFLQIFQLPIAKLFWKILIDQDTCKRSKFLSHWLSGRLLYKGTKKLKLEVFGLKRSFTFSYFFPPLIMSSSRRFITFYSVGVPFAQP